MLQHMGRIALLSLLMLSLLVTGVNGQTEPPIISQGSMGNLKQVYTIELPDPDAKLADFAFTQNGQLIVAYQDGEMPVWDLAQKTIVRYLKPEFPECPNNCWLAQLTTAPSRGYTAAAVSRIEDHKSTVTTFLADKILTFGTFEVENGSRITDISISQFEVAVGIFNFVGKHQHRVEVHEYTGEISEVSYYEVISPSVVDISKGTLFVGLGNQWGRNADQIYVLTGNEILDQIMYDGHDKTINAMSLHPWEDYIITGDGIYYAETFKLILWKLGQDTSHAEFDIIHDTEANPGISGGVSALAFTPDGLAVAVGLYGDTIMFYAFNDLVEKRLGEPVIYQEGTGSKLVFSPDGRRMVTAGQDGVITVWEVAN